jgi:hypothetical protein
MMPDALSPDRRALLLDLERLWLRRSDFRFGQILRAAVERPGARPVDLTDEAVRAGLDSVLETTPEVSPPSGPYWDTEATRGRTFANGRPRDPARIPRLLTAFAGAWTVYPDLTLGGLVDFALDGAGIPENEFGTRWLLIDDGPMRRALQVIADGPNGPERGTRGLPPR